MRKLRDVFYINAYPANKEFVYYGLEFQEFIKFIPTELDNILLIKFEYFGAGYRVKYNFETVNREEMQEFVNEDIYGYGDFCWVDFKDLDNVDALKPEEAYCKID